MIEAICAHAMFFYYMSKYAGLPTSQLLFSFDKFKGGFQNQSEEKLREFVQTGQSVYFMTLVLCQFGNLIATRPRRGRLSSWFSFSVNAKTGRQQLERQPNVFRRHWHLLLAMLCSLVFALLIIFVPFFNSTFGTRPIPTEFFFIPLTFAIAIAAIGQLLK
jgi:sodium/potassium-transporting ATPase subunit alpha